MLVSILRAIFYGVIEIAIIGVVIHLLGKLLEDVFNISIFCCFSKECWRETPFACIICSLIFLIAVFVFISAVVGGYQGFEDLPVNNYDYERSDEPYRTWP